MVFIKKFMAEEFILTFSFDEQFLWNYLTQYGYSYASSKWKKTKKNITNIFFINLHKKNLQTNKHAIKDTKQQQNDFASTIVFFYVYNSH